jgi:hypothetical protein
MPALIQAGYSKIWNIHLRISYPHQYSILWNKGGIVKQGNLWKVAKSLLKQGLLAGKGYFWGDWGKLAGGGKWYWQGWVK